VVKLIEHKDCHRCANQEKCTTRASTLCRHATALQSTIAAAAPLDPHPVIDLDPERFPPPLAFGAETGSADASG
jgi:hypothetical protein